MSFRKTILLVIVVLTVSACATTKQFESSNFQPPTGDYKLIVMQPDISVGLLTMGGLVEPREDWTNQARENVLKALADQQAERGGKTRIAMTLEEAGGDPAAVHDLVSLHNAVGRAIFVHKYLAPGLPTKKDVFDWTLGQTAVEYGALTEFDYALFLHAEGSFSSDARAALQVAGLLSCALGYCVGISGGNQIAFASLVDLSTGRITWFNVLSSNASDIRTPEGANKMIDQLLATMHQVKENQ